MKIFKHVHVRDIVSLYSDSNMIIGFCRNIRFSSKWNEEDVILKPSSETERDNTDTLGGLYIPNFHLHLPVIHQLGVLITFAPFKLAFLMTANVVSPKSHTTYGPSLRSLRPFVSIWVSSPLLG